MKRKIPIIIVVLAILTATAIWLARSRSLAPEEGGLRLFGNVDIREVNLGFRVAGKLAQVLKEEGDPVQAGELLAKLDAAPYERELEQARSEVEAARARLALLEAGSRPQEIEQARALVREREVSLANAKRLYERQQELSASGAISRQEYDDAEARYREAEARLNLAREQANLLEAGFRQEEIAQAKAQLNQAEAAMRGAELRVEDTLLKAPADGVIITRAREPGAILQPGGETVLTLSLRAPVWVRAYVIEPNLGRIHPGMPVRVYTDTRPEAPYQAQIGFISPKAEFTPKSVETQELRTSLVYRVRVVVENPDEGLRQGMPVTVIVNGNQ